MSNVLCTLTYGLYYYTICRQYTTINGSVSKGEDYGI